MKKKAISLLLALAMCLALLPVAASAAEPDLPDWYFLFAIFKNVDADGKDKDGKDTHVTYTMSQVEVDTARDYAREFEAYMNQHGIIRAHVEVVEINETVTELTDANSGSYISQSQATHLLKKKVDLDRYDHVACFISLDNLTTSYLGITGSAFENGAGHSCINFINQESCLKSKTIETNPWVPGVPVHEFLHSMERLDRKWGWEFKLHDIMHNFYGLVNGEYEECYTDIILNRAKGNMGTGVPPAVWQYPPHMMRTMTELNVPSGVTGIGEWAFQNNDTLTKVTIPSSVSRIEYNAFGDCDNLTEAFIFSSAPSIGEWAFGVCPALTRVSIPASVTSIEGAAFYKTGLKDVYYAGTEAQWKAIQIGDYNRELTNAKIHYNRLLADVKTTDYFAQPVAWALENGVTAGTGNGNFSPGQNCTVAQILTFLWRANGSPKPAGKNPFSDVKNSDYYANAAAWAYEKGLVSGKTFNGNTPCTRSMAATYLWKAAGSPTPSGKAGFTDVPANADYAQAVNWAVEKGVTTGTSATAFSPDHICTRGQIATFLHRALAE